MRRRESVRNARNFMRNIVTPHHLNDTASFVYSRQMNSAACTLQTTAITKCMWGKCGSEFSSSVGYMQTKFANCLICDMVLHHPNFEPTIVTIFYQPLNGRAPIYGSFRRSTDSSVIRCECTAVYGGRAVKFSHFFHSPRSARCSIQTKDFGRVRMESGATPQLHANVSIRRKVRWIAIASLY